MNTSTALPLACATWLVSILSLVLHAQPSAPAAARPSSHRDLSLFTPSQNCVACHNNLVAPDGEDVSIGSSWRSSMMANSARDPYWHAGVRRETLDHPAHADEIQDECASCHMPMTRRIAKAGGGLGEVFTHLPVANNGSDPVLQQLAADGVSCTVCHQIGADKLGTPESFNANFTLAPTPRDGARLIFGPDRIDAGRQAIMRSVTGFVQAEAPHIKQSELCASCHTLITKAFGRNGEVVGSLAEQMNYQEWRHSAFDEERRSCQSCHMPVAAGPIRTSSVLGDHRESLSRHLFVGGNAFMVRMLSRYRRELGVAASGAELEATAAATVRQLREETAALTVSVPTAAGGVLRFEVEVTNLTGHKFPTGYPSRRAWLHVIVHDAAGRPVFESGAVDASGRIAGNDGDREAPAYEPHYEQITDPDEVQIYEPVLGDLYGVPTTGLLTATQYLKDNRLLPRGFDKATADAEIGVFGGAAGDADFLGGGDRLRYAAPVSSAGPFRVEVELRYQSIGYRWAHNLEKYDAPEPQRFVSYYESMAASSSVVVARAQTATR
jgi:mono/diheme cytochrome c family protein